MAHLMSPSRLLLLSMSRLRICQSCALQSTNKTIRYATTEAVIPAQSTELIESEDKSIILTQSKATYIPASNWDGLERVGSKKYIWNHTPITLSEKHRKRWAPQETSSLTLEQSEQAVLNSLIDSILVHYTSNTPNSLSEQSVAEHAAYSHAKDVVISYNKDKQPVLRFKSVSALNGIKELAQVLGADPVKLNSIIDENIISTGKDASTRPWQVTQLPNDQLRFLLISRIFQRTGRRLPDHAMRNCRVAGKIFDLLTKKPVAKTPLAERVEGEGALNLANVVVSNERVTKIHNDISVGRWKLTRQKLAERGLPEFWERGIGGRKARRA